MEELGGRDYRRISPDSGSVFQTILKGGCCFADSALVVKKGDNFHAFIPGIKNPA